MYCLIITGFQNVRHRYKMRLVVKNNAGIGRNTHLTVCKSIQGINRNIGRYPRCQVNDNLYIFGREVFHGLHSLFGFFDFYFSFFAGFDDGVLDGSGGRTERNFPNHQRFFVQLLNLSPDAHFSAPQSIVIVGNINVSSRWKIRKEGKRLTFENGDGGFEQFHKIVRHDLGRKPDGNPFHTHGQQQRKFNRQCDRFALATVVTHLPFGSIFVENYVIAKFRKSNFNVTGRRSAVARANISPTSLRIKY